MALNHALPFTLGSNDGRSDEHPARAASRATIDRFAAAFRERLGLRQTVASSSTARTPARAAS